MRLGSHVSAAGGVDKAPQRGLDIGCQCIQVFTRNQRTWKAKPVDQAEVQAFRERRQSLGIEPVMSHASYLINLAAPDETTYARSRAAMAAELERCHTLGIELLNFHPGAHRDSGVEAAIQRIADALNALCRDYPDATDVKIVLENVAGQGTTVGRTFEELAEVFGRLDAPERFGVCLDTAHAFAAGYALQTERGWDDMWRRFEACLGLHRLSACHINDSKVGLGERKDRHELIGRGKIGPAAFCHLVTDPRTRDVPMFLETPAGPAGWAKELAWLHKAADGETPPLPDIKPTGPRL